MGDGEKNQFRSLVGEFEQFANSSAELAHFCQCADTATDLDEPARALVDAVFQVLHCDYVGYFVLSALNHAVLSHHSLGHPDIEKDGIPLDALVHRIVKQSEDDLNTRPIRHILNADQMAGVFAPRQCDVFNQGLLSTLPSPVGDLIHVLLIGFRDLQPGLPGNTHFLDALLGVANLSRQKISSQRRLKAEHQRVVKAKQEWQCSVDALHELVCLVDSSGAVVRANKTLEKLGLGRVTKVRGTYIWELFGLLDDLCSSGDGKRVEELFHQEQKNWNKRWQSVVERAYIDWDVYNDSNEWCYRIAMSLVDLSTPSRQNTKQYAVVIVREVSRSQPLARQKGIDSEDSIELIRNLKSKEEELLAANRQLETLSNELIETQEEERARVALDLHDGLGQELVMLKLRMDGFLADSNASYFPRDPAECMKEMRKYVRNAIEETRRIGMNLRPRMLDNLGVEPALRWFFREFEKTHPAIEMSVEIAVDEGLLTSMLETEIFRITQEAMNNISKHADASSVRYQLVSNEQAIRLKIEDDGVGFDTDRDCESSAGLRNMLQRALRSGGQFGIQSALGGGARVMVEWQR